MLGVSVDSKYAHLAWIKRGDLGKVGYPLLSDLKREAAERYGVLDEDGGIAQRGLFIIDPEGTLHIRWCTTWMWGEVSMRPCGTGGPADRLPLSIGLEAGEKTTSK